MTGNIIAQRYAHALFSIAQNQDSATLEHCGVVLEELASAISVSPDLQRVLGASVITLAEKEQIIVALLQRVATQPLMIRFCKLLAERNRLPLLPAIAVAFAMLLDEANGLLRGNVTTAIQLDEQEQKNLLHSLGAKSSRTLHIDFGVDADLLGGIVLQVGNIVLDASLRAQLARLKDTMAQVDN